jgi:hypothetical protein
MAALLQDFPPCLPPLLQDSSAQGLFLHLRMGLRMCKGRHRVLAGHAVPAGLL